MSGREAECARLEIVYTGWLVSGVQIPPHPPIITRPPYLGGLFIIVEDGRILTPEGGGSLQGAGGRKNAGDRRSAPQRQLERSEE